MRDEEIIYTKVLLVGVDTGEEQDFEHSMKELKSLAEAAYKETVGIIIQRMPAVNKALYIGSGKVAEVKEYAAQCEAEEIVFDNALSPSQIRNLAQELELPIIDRTNLILDIFAIRARTREAKLQVETAQLQYMLPRLVGMRENLSRQGGTGGSMSNKGAGETKLELDRRKIEHRISELKKELEAVARTRETMRKKRSQSRTPQVALVGYTNAGKSTIMNRMVDLYGENNEKTVLEKDMLFATLETNVRNINLGDNKPFFLSDTVGFIHKLPHGLVKAFQSTLEEVKYADVLIQVVDFSDEHYRTQMEVTEETLRELEAGDIPQIIVYNKADICNMENLPRRKGNQIYMSAVSGCGIAELAEMIQEQVYAGLVDAEFLIPYDKGNVASYLMENVVIKSTEYCEEGVRLKAAVTEAMQINLQLTGAIDCKKNMLYDERKISLYGRKRETMGKKKGLAFLLAVTMTLGLSACGKNTIPEMTEEELQAVGEYAAITLMKYDANHRSRLVDLSLLEEKEPEVVLPGESESLENVNSSASSSTEKTSDVQNSYTMEQVMALPDGVSVSYLGHELSEKYPAGEEDYFAILPSEGKKLLVLEFTMENSSEQNTEVDILATDCSFQITVNGNYTRKPLMTMLENDMSTYRGEIPAGEGREMVLVMETDETVTDLSSIVLSLKNEAKTYTIPLI